MGQELSKTPYDEYLRPLYSQVVGKTVARTVPGTSGFMLTFSDASWVMVYLEEMQLHWRCEHGNVTEIPSDLINSSECGDGRNPIPANRPYAKENCDISAEISHATGKTITGLSIGSNCFNFCFPDGLELETSIVQTSEGKPALRVFWEQW